MDTTILDQQMTQNIFDILQMHLPSGWLEVNFFAGYYKDDSGFFKYWVKTSDGKYISCFTLIPEPNPGEKDILQEQLSLLHREMKSVRTKLPKEQKWVCMEMSVTNKGQLSKNYDYADGIAEENLMQYIKDYRQKLNQKYI